MLVYYNDEGDDDNDADADDDDDDDDKDVDNDDEMMEEEKESRRALTIGRVSATAHDGNPIAKSHYSHSMQRRDDVDVWIGDRDGEHQQQSVVTDENNNNNN